MLKNNQYTNFQLAILVTARVIAGWYFLYEGMVKLLNPNWTSLAYLVDSKGFLSGVFHALATSPAMVTAADFLNIWGLIAIGAGLLLGIFTRIASVSGIVLLCLYYLSHPAFIGADYVLPSEGNYLWVNKIMLDIFLLLILTVFPTGKIIGLDRLIFGQGSDQNLDRTHD